MLKLPLRISRVLQFFILRWTKYLETQTCVRERGWFTNLLSGTQRTSTSQVSGESRAGFWCTNDTVSWTKIIATISDQTRTETMYWGWTDCFRSVAHQRDELFVAGSRSASYLEPLSSRSLEECVSQATLSRKKTLRATRFSLYLLLLSSCVIHRWSCCALAHAHIISLISKL